MDRTLSVNGLTVDRLIDETEPEQGGSDMEFAPRVLLPSQVEREALRVPMARVAHALLHQTLRDLRHAQEQCELRDRRRQTWWRPRFEEAMAWVDGAEATLSFEVTCQLLNVDEGWLREQIKEWVRAGCAGKIRRWMRIGLRPNGDEIFTSEAA